MYYLHEKTPLCTLLNNVSVLNISSLVPLTLEEIIFIKRGDDIGTVHKYFT